MTGSSRWVVSLVLICLASVSYATADPVRYDGHRVIGVDVATPAQLELLLTLTDDVWTDPPGLGRVDVRVNEQQFEQIRAAGLPYEVKIADLQTLIDQQFTPAGETRDAFDNYMTYSQVLNYLNTLVALRPDLAETFVVGQTVEGRDIVGIRFTGAGTQTKPGIFYHGGQHAREWITVPAALYVADQLLREYDNDPYIHDLVDRLEWFIVPVMNPDGYIYSHTSDRMWRKNRRYNGSGIWGVDLNRNWGVGWGGAGSSGFPNDQTYRGPSAFSEPETQAMRDWILNHTNIVAHCDLHSYSQLIMYPYGYTGSLPSFYDRLQYEFLAESMADIVHSVHGETYEYGPVYSTIYVVGGGSIDWVYDVGGAFSFTYELRDDGSYGFVLPAWQIRPNCEEVFPALLFYAEQMYRDCNENGVWDREDIASGTSPDCNFNNVPDECEPGGTTDCNSNGEFDVCDIYTGFSTDCNDNAVPDECDIISGTSPDCQSNGIPDECDLAPPMYTEPADSCADALLVCPNTPYTGTTTGATNDGSADCGSSDNSPDVWYFYRPYGSGFLDVSLCGSDFDTVLSVHTGVPGTAANQIGCNDDLCNEQSRVEVIVSSGNPYWIRISGKSGATGEFLMNITGPDCEFDAECNDNGIPDECEPDCNGNGQPDDCDIAAGTSTDANENGIPDECENCGDQLLADANCDGTVNAFDIDPFVLALSDAGAWATAYPACDLLCVCDCNGDGTVNAFDIDTFATLLAGGQ